MCRTRTTTHAPRNLVHETGDLTFFDEEIPFRDGGVASVYEHILSGLKYIQARRGPHGLPLLAHADWNDGLAVFHDENAESVMLGMQVVYSAKLFRDFARRFGRNADVAWCDAVIAELDASLTAQVFAWQKMLPFSPAPGALPGSGSSGLGSPV